MKPNALVLSATGRTAFARALAGLFIIAPLNISQAATTDLPALTPDRPGFTNGSDTVLKGLTQLEIGIAQTRAQSTDGGSLVTDYPEMLLRHGINQDLEVRLAVPDYFTGSGTSGVGDASLGVKWKFYQSKDGNTKAALTPAITLPSHNDDFSSTAYDPSLTFGIQQPSGSRWNNSANLAISDPTVDGDRMETAAPSVATSYQLTAKLAAYGELFDSFPKQGAPSPIVDGGFTFLPKNNLQWDAEIGLGLGGAAPVRFIGGGVAMRF